MELKPDLKRDIEQFLYYKLKTTPPIIDYNYRYTPEELCEKIVNEWRVKNVAVDFDRTLVQSHTRGYDFVLDQIPRHDYVIELVKLLLKKGIRVSVATFCYHNLDKIREFCKLVFDQEIRVEGTQCRDSGKNGLVEYLFQKFYMNVETEEWLDDSDILGETVLIDDDIDNIKRGLKRNMRGIHIDIQSKYEKMSHETHRQIGGRYPAHLRILGSRVQVSIDAIPFDEIKFKPKLFKKPPWSDLYYSYKDFTRYVLDKGGIRCSDKRNCKYYKIFENLYFDTIKLNCEFYGWKVDVDYLQSILYQVWTTEDCKRIMMDDDLVVN